FLRRPACLYCPCRACPKDRGCFRLARTQKKFLHWGSKRSGTQPNPVPPPALALPFFVRSLQRIKHKQPRRLLPKLCFLSFSLLTRIRLLMLCLRSLPCE